MKSVLQQLYYGAISPFEIPAPRSQAYQDAQTRLVEHEDRFAQAYQAALPELEQILDIHRNVCAMETEDMFYHGFCLGIKLLAEALYRKE